VIVVLAGAGDDQKRGDEVAHPLRYLTPSLLPRNV